MWRSLEGTKHLISKGACLQVGSGNFIRIWEDPWVPDFPSFIPKPKEGVDIGHVFLWPV